MVIGPTFDNLFRRTTAIALFATTLLAIFAIGPVSKCDADHPAKGSSSKKFKNQTLQSIPFEQLNEQARIKISDTLNKPSVYRRLPVTSINADPDYFRFLVRYPEVVVNIWKLMGVTKMTSERTGPYSVTSNDGAGTISALELVYGTDNLHIYYGTGSYEGAFFKRKLTGKCVLVLRSEAKAGPDGKPVITTQLDVFLKIDNAAAGLIAKTVHPIIGPTADHNFVESLKFIQRLNETTQKNGPGVQRMGQRLDLDTEVHQKLNEVVEVVFRRAINATATGEPAIEAIPSHENFPGSQHGFRETPPETGVPLTQNRHSNSQTRLIHARGYQAPLYSTGVTNGQAFYPQGYARPTQATYEAPKYYLAPPHPVQNAGWYQR